MGTRRYTLPNRKGLKLNTESVKRSNKELDNKKREWKSKTILDTDIIDMFRGLINKR